jgi:hypothetical protein
LDYEVNRRQFLADLDWARLDRLYVEAQPQLATIDTWNAESNDHMIGVNEAVGYRVMGRALAFQRSV